MTNLYCPNCDYNLAGLLENRCPECGTTFDPTELLKLTAASPKPISVSIVILHLIWPAAVFTLLIYVAGITGLEWLNGTFVISLIVILFVNAAVIARRVAATSSVRRGGSPYHRSNPASFFRAMVGLVLMQTLLALTGCYAALKFAY